MTSASIPRYMLKQNENTQDVHTNVHIDFLHKLQSPQTAC